MSDLRKAAEMALGALEIWEKMQPNTTACAARIPAVQALRQALAESTNSTTSVVESQAPAQPEQKREWVGVTYDEVYEFVCTTDSYINLAKAIEAKLKEKNT